MNPIIRIGILKETKTPPDRRVPLTPVQVAELRRRYPQASFVVQSSNLRCYSDKEYTDTGTEISDKLNDCDILFGVKEVDKKTFIEGKRYLFFAHVAKEQPYNREMFREIVKKGITLTDYEYLVDEKGSRVVAFGRWAGIVGAYNALIGAGCKTGLYNLKQANKCYDLQEMWTELDKVKLPCEYKIVVTGDGRVAGGAMEVLNRCKLRVVTPEEYLNDSFSEPVVCQIVPSDYTKRRDNRPFEWQHFITNPQEYVSTFAPYTSVTDIFIACHYWDPASPHFFTAADAKRPDFKISLIADVSCDIDGPIPTTLRASTIAEPFFDYNRSTGLEEEPFSAADNITVMSIDNLPGELPRDASDDFGRQLTDSVIDDLINRRDNRMLDDATITKGGELTEPFAFLKNYLESRNING
jgi:saccharopine dehydrogenase (NAD+, L-lysine forming)